MSKLHPQQETAPAQEGPAKDHVWSGRNGAKSVLPHALVRPGRGAQVRAGPGTNTPRPQEHRRRWCGTERVTSTAPYHSFFFHWRTQKRGRNRHRLPPHRTFRTRRASRRAPCAPPGSPDAPVRRCSRPRPRRSILGHYLPRRAGRRSKSLLIFVGKTTAGRRMGVRLAGQGSPVRATAKRRWGLRFCRTAAKRRDGKMVGPRRP